MIRQNITSTELSRMPRKNVSTLGEVTEIIIPANGGPSQIYINMEMYQYADSDSQSFLSGKQY